MTTVPSERDGGWCRAKTVSGYCIDAPPGYVGTGGRKLACGELWDAKVRSARKRETTTRHSDPTIEFKGRGVVTSRTGGGDRKS